MRRDIQTERQTYGLLPCNNSGEAWREGCLNTPEGSTSHPSVMKAYKLLKPELFSQAFIGFSYLIEES